MHVNVACYGFCISALRVLQQHSKPHSKHGTLQNVPDPGGSSWQE